MYLASASSLLLYSTLLPTLSTAYKPLSDSFLRAIPSPNAFVDLNNATSALTPLLIPRVPGTPGQIAAQTHLHSFFTTHLPSWTLEWQNSTSTTPATGSRKIPFANLIAKREPPWTKPGEANLLTLVAHYDSKRLPEGFLGATDSAVPCAVLMYVATVIDRYVSQMYSEMSELGEGGEVDMDMGVQILFLDGEEAFKDWTDTDSLYGARSLAETWASKPNPAGQKFYKYRTPLNQISLFVLLDLLGAANPSIPSYFPTTHWAYNALSTLESRMRSLRILESNPPHPFLPDVNGTMSSYPISDDHLPFIHRGVETLHVIPQPFPGVWHTMRDNGENLDMGTVRDWCRIVAGFTLEWLDMMEVWTEPEPEPAAATGTAAETATSTTAEETQTSSLLDPATTARPEIGTGGKSDPATMERPTIETSGKGGVKRRRIWNFLG